MNQSQKVCIDGVIIKPLERISDVRGTIMHGVKKNTLLNPFGEIYFKKLYHGIINGWHVHETLVLNYICVYGMIRLVLYDLRKDSKTYQKIQQICIGDDNYSMVHIPSGIANAMESLVPPYSIICNIASEQHNPNLKYKRIDPDLKKIPFDWEKKNY
jgi:dTDP-4-dehydrorhamnose 3,5-epimerase